ncbi:MAG: polymer-forming cytoskeletal protein [Deltaproteobacteria bacterium]|nr:polymer-forming cytoskeletal protein [Deltaproteobacteria bacterium]
MWKKEGKVMDSLGRGEVNAFLGGETSFDGKLSYSGAVRLDGRFKGEIHSEDILVVGETAKIEGKINVGAAIIQGEVVGNITAKEKVELQHPGRVIGDITTPSIIIDDGAIFEGNCKMKERKKEERKDERGVGPFPRKKETEVKEEKTEEGTQ